MLYTCIKSVTTVSTFVMTISLATFPSSASAWFAFSKDKYVEYEVNTYEDVEVTMAMQLQSCRGVTPGSSWTRLGCEDFKLEENYYLTASDFKLNRVEGSEGQAGSDVNIAKVEFRQGANSLNLQNNIESAAISPGTYLPVDSTMIFTIYNSVLEQALPGTYNSKLNLFGTERGVFEYSDNTLFEFSIKIPERLKISNLKPVELQSNGNSAPITSNWHNFCVFSQGGSKFQLRAYGNNEPDRFILKISKTDKDGIPYTLTVQSLSEGGETEINPNAAEGSSSDYTWKGSASQNCFNGNNMSLQVAVNDPTGIAGVYSDVVTIVVEPPK